MRLRWVLLITIAFGLLVGPLVKDIPGFVVIALGDYTVQTRLWQAIVVIFLLLLFFILLYHLIARVWNGASRFRSWSGGRRWEKSRQRTIKGIIALSEGDWKNAEKLLTSAGNDSDTPLINFLAAAQAAQFQKADARRDNYLQQAHLVEPKAEIAIGLTQAQLQLDHGQVEQALATLTQLKNISPKHHHILFLLQKIYRHIGDWQRFIDMVPDLKKASSLSEDELEQFQLLAWQNILIKEATTSGIEAVHLTWMSVPKNFSKNVVLIVSYAELLIRHGSHLEAEKMLNTNIRKLQDEKSLYLYGKVLLDDPIKQLAFVESLHKTFPDNAIYNLTLGRICLSNKLWGKARTALEESLALNPAAETYQELARAFEALGEMDAAKKCYREGLAESINKPAVSV